MKSRGSRENLEGWLHNKTAPAPPVTKPARPPSATASTGTTEATLMISLSLLARVDQVIE